MNILKWIVREVQSRVDGLEPRVDQNEQDIIDLSDRVKELEEMQRESQDQPFLVAEDLNPECIKKDEI